MPVQWLRGGLPHIEREGCCRCGRPSDSSDADQNVPQLNALTAENLTYGHSSGKIQDKKEFIADIETGKSAFKTLEMQNQKITVSGDVALVRHHFSAQAIKGTEIVPTEIENFQIWQKQQGKWLLVGRQAFRL